MNPREDRAKDSAANQAEQAGHAVTGTLQLLQSARLG